MRACLTSASNSSACVPCGKVEPSTPLPTMIFMPLVAGRHRDGLLEDRDHPVLAAGVLVVVVVHVRLGVALQRRVVGEALRDHHVGLLLIEAEGVLDGVAAGDDGVLLPLAAVDVAAGLLAEAMRLVDQRLQHRHRIGQHVLRSPVGVNE